MRVDWQTLQDLGILQPAGNQASIFDWANFTRTAGGAQLLKKRFQHPLSDVHVLRETQAAVVWLGEHSDLLTPVLEGSAWASIERYADSSVTLLAYPNPLLRWLDSWWVRFDHRVLFDEVRAALALSQTLLRCADSVTESMSAPSLPSVLRKWRADVQECIGTPALSRLRGGTGVHRLRPPSVLALDGELRRLKFAPLRKLASLIYEIDVISSLALATQRHGLVMPEILEDGLPRIEAEGLYHPLLDRPVSNPLEIHRGASLVFLTGPNMAGKSTFLKAAGVAVFLAQVGMGVPAAAFRTTPFDCLFSGINTTDNLRLGQSYFYGEVRRVRGITEILGNGASAFVLFDEMFKGTNLKDASDACLAVLTGFASCNTSAFMVASHIAELAEGLAELADVRFLKFGAAVREGQVEFDYRIHEGVSDQRLGMHILEREGVLSSLAALGASAPAT